MKKSKLVFFFTGAVLFLALVVYVFGNRLIFYTVQYGLKKSFPQYEVSLKEVFLRPDSLVLYGIQAKNIGMSLEAGEAQLFFKPFEIIRGRFEKMTVVNMRVQAHDVLVKNINISLDGNYKGELSAERIDYQKIYASAIHSPFYLHFI